MISDVLGFTLYLTSHLLEELTMWFPQLLIPLLFLMSCSRQEFEAETDIVRNSLKDPSSAQFRNLRAGKSNRSVCGEINAKNIYGGYVGFHLFVVVDGVAYMNPVESCPEPPELSLDKNARLSREELMEILDKRSNSLRKALECNKAIVLVAEKMTSECEER